MDTGRGNTHPSADLSAGMRVSVVSAAWTIVTSVAAIAVGIADGRLVLVVFGATGLLDAVGSIALALHFRHAIRHRAISEARERFALRIVSAGLIAIALATSVESIRHLVGDATGQSSPVGVSIAAASLVVLAVLARIKWRVAARLPSPALRADSSLSATGAGLAAVTIAGVVAGERYDWIDPVAALVVAVAASVVGLTAFRREEKELR